MNSPVPHSETGRILVVDDHAAARESVADVLRQAGYQVHCLASAVEALAHLQAETYDVVITDLQMPGMDGLEFIRQINQLRLRVQVLMVTAHATISSAVEAMRCGAFDYLEKPFDASQLEQLVARAVWRGKLLAPEPGPQVGNPASAADLDLGMVGHSPAMQQLRKRLQQVAPTDETVLICGESGTGKELVARAIHQLSLRSAGEMVSLNCPALSPQLTESEFDERVGRFELAAGGTIFLDEVTEIDPPLQAKLLRVLQQRTFERVGCSVTRVADVRVLASSNRDLPEEVAAGRFRQDLYYRLAVVPLVLPPLRERGEDVHLLADHFLARAAQRLGRPCGPLAADTRTLFANYHWPGNVRELENIVTRACVLSDGNPITAAELQPWLEAAPDAADPDGPMGLPVGSRLEDVEREMIIATLEHFQGHRAKTAAALGIGVRTLSGKLKTYGLAPRAKSFGAADGATVAQPTTMNRHNLPLATADFAAGKLGKSA